MDRRQFLKGTALASAGAALAAGGLASCAQPGAPLPYRVPDASEGKRLSLHFYPYELQLHHTFTVSSYSRKTTPGVQVEISFDGFTGYGEASMPPYLGQSVASVTAFLEKTDLSRFADPFRMEDILDYVNGLSEQDSAAKAAVDIALHDLVGKLLGQPLWRLWGYDPGKAPLTTYTIGIDTPEVVREKTRECADHFRILKVKVGTEHDVEMVQTIREITDLPLAVDANQGWTDRIQALEMIAWLKEQGVVLVEQPMPKERLDDIAFLTENCGLPVFADESVQGLADVIAVKGAYSGINIKLMKCGGLREARKMLTYARAEGLQVMLGCMTETSCGISAAAQLSPAVDFADLDGNLLIDNDLFDGVGVTDGRLVLRDRPGIGLLPK